MWAQCDVIIGRHFVSGIPRSSWFQSCSCSLTSTSAMLHAVGSGRGGEETHAWVRKGGAFLFSGKLST